MPTQVIMFYADEKWPYIVATSDDILASAEFVAGCKKFQNIDLDMCIVQA